MRRPIAAPGLVLALLAAAPAPCAPLVADISNKEIAITTGFAGADLLLFGALDAQGDVVVVVRGPARREIVRRKERVVGVWLNGESVAFNDVPGYYFVAASRPLDEVAPSETLKRHQIGIERLCLPSSNQTTPCSSGDFREGLVRAMQNRDLYTEMPAPVTVLDNRLFRTTIGFPANVPTGVYTAEVYLFRDGRLASTAKTPVIVRKAGIEARIYDFAHERAALYGIVAILIALMAGWVAGAVFRKP